MEKGRFVGHYSVDPSGSQSAPLSRAEHRAGHFGTDRRIVIGQSGGGARKLAQAEQPERGHASSMRTALAQLYEQLRFDVAISRRGECGGQA